MPPIEIIDTFNKMKHNIKDLINTSSLEITQEEKKTTTLKNIQNTYIFYECPNYIKVRLKCLTEHS